MAMADRTLVDTLARQVRERPLRPAIRRGGRVLGFAELDDESARLAQALKAMGVGPGDRVACLSQHHIECLLLTLAACRLGAVCLPVNWRLSSQELEYILDPATTHGPDYPTVTFPGLKKNELAKYGEYRTRRLVLEAWDRQS